MRDTKRFILALVAALGLATGAYAQGTKLPNQLTAATSIAPGDLMLVWPTATTGPLKQVQFSVLEAQVQAALGTAYLQTTNNLSDLTNSSVARGNLGLGGASLLNVGTSTGTVAAGDDSRFSSSCQLVGCTFTGNVGIGIAPTKPLQVAGTASGEVSIEATNGLTNYRTWNFLVDGGASNKQEFILRQLNDAGSAVQLTAFSVNGTTGNITFNGVSATTGTFSSAVSASGFTGPLTGAVTGNVTGSISGGTVAGSTGTFTGAVSASGFTGPLTGAVTGNVTGSISGGTVAGSTGTFSGAVSGSSFTGPLTGNVTGNVSGSISGGTVAGSTGTFSGAVSGSTASFSTSTSAGALTASTGGFSGTVTTPTLAIDSQYQLFLSGSNPRLNLDSSDYLTYDRTNNFYNFVIGGSVVTSLGSAGSAISNALTITSGNVDVTTVNGPGFGVRVRAQSGGGPGIIQFTDNTVTGQWNALSVAGSNLPILANGSAIVRVTTGGTTANSGAISWGTATVSGTLDVGQIYLQTN